MEAVLGCYLQQSLAYVSSTWKPYGHKLWLKGDKAADVHPTLVESRLRSQWTHTPAMIEQNIQHYTQCSVLSPWLNVAVQCLNYDPTQRPSLSQLRSMCEAAYKSVMEVRKRRALEVDPEYWENLKQDSGASDNEDN